MKTAQNERIPQIPDGVFVRLIELPRHVGGVTSVDSDGCYNVYINLRLDDEGRRRALRHELAHIRLGHFHQPDRPLAEREAEAEAAE